MFAVPHQLFSVVARDVDFLACLALVQRLLGARSPFGGAAPGGLDAALAEGLDVVRGPVRLAEVRVPSEAELRPLLATARVTMDPRSKALSTEGALSSSDPAQRAAAAVPGAATNCLVLWQRGTPRPMVLETLL